ncbi:MAG: carbohydrate-binding domain-containing protein [Oscillospiraceae bacterium]|nr:carbohydrate-binding domain-containing protein [Oscillospiraceae bacterium]
MNFIKEILAKCKGFFVDCFTKVKDSISNCNPKVLKISAISGGGALIVTIGLIVWFSVGGNETLDIVPAVRPTGTNGGGGAVNRGDEENPRDAGFYDDGHETAYEVSFTDEAGDTIVIGTPGSPSATTAARTTAARTGNSTTSAGGTQATQQQTTSGGATTPGQQTTTPPQDDGETFVRITLNGSSATSTTAIGGAVAEIGTRSITINHPGEYLVTGTIHDGSIVVAAQGDVTLRLAGVNITRSDGPAIRTTREMEGYKLTIILEGDNTLRDGRPWSPPRDGIEDPDADGEAEDTPATRNGAIFSRAIELVITGSGKLNIHGGHGHGINSRNALTLLSTNVEVDAPTHGLRSRIQTTIVNSNVTIRAGSKGIRGAGANHGHVNVMGSTLNINSTRDAIHSEAGISLEHTNYTATVHGGWTSGRSEETMRGLRSGGNVTINGGMIVLNCAEDAISASNEVFINGATLDLHSSRRAIRGQFGVTVNSSDVTVHVSNHGFRGLNVFINGTSLNIHFVGKFVETGYSGNQARGIPPQTGGAFLDGQDVQQLPIDVLASMMSRCAGCHTLTINHSDD